MSILTIQRERIGAALWSVLRAATGRNPSRAEINSWVNAYLTNLLPRGLGPSDRTPATAPLFRAADYTPLSANDPLGGADGRDISRAFAAQIEDLDTARAVLTEAERRLSVARSLLRQQSSAEKTALDQIASDADGVVSQLRSLFFGGGSNSSGRGRLVWDVTPQTLLVSPQTTGVVLSSGVGVLPTRGTSASGGSDGGAISRLQLVSSSDPTLLQSAASRAFLESPLSSSTSWTFSETDAVPAKLSFRCVGGSNIGAFEIEISAGVAVTSVVINGATQNSFQSLTEGSTLWIVPSIPAPAGSTVDLTFRGLPTANTTIRTGSILLIRAHIFSFDSQASLVWGPFSSQAEVGADALFAVTLERSDAAIPSGAGVSYQASTTSADGPWVSLPGVGQSVVLGASGRNQYTLLATEAQPDPKTQSFYRFPFTDAGSLVGAEFSAGAEQFQAEAYEFNWTFAGSLAHEVAPTDWANPEGTIRSVAMGAAPAYLGHLTDQSFASTEYAAQGTCISRYQDNLGADLLYIPLRGDNNEFILQQGMNYRFSIALYTTSPSYLANVPIGIFNPNGEAGLYGVPILAELNGQQVYRGYGTFQDYAELSPQSATYGQLPGDFPAGQGQWPPYCGRMNLALRPGWNLFQLSCYVPSGDARIDANLLENAGIIFGPSLFADPGTRLQKTGIQSMRGWQAPWVQLSEFDLRLNNSMGRTDVWAWEVDPVTRGVTSLLLNHNPSISETGYTTLDGVISGQPRTHQISYLPRSTSSGGGDPGNPQLWVRALLSSSQPESGPIVGGFSVSVN